MGWLDTHLIPHPTPIWHPSDTHLTPVCSVAYLWVGQMVIDDRLEVRVRARVRVRVRARVSVRVRVRVTVRVKVI